MESGSMKLYQINDDDLAKLERAVPLLCQSISVNTSNADRVLMRQVKQILSDVRWEYQPWTNIQEIPADGG